jgi:FtsZ-binding cell division protein ZapB
MSKLSPHEKDFEQLQQSAPEYPDHTCPEIDTAKDMMEALREKNSSLRQGLQFWRSHCRELLKLLPAKERKKYIKDMES